MAYDPTERLAEIRDQLDVVDQGYGAAAEAIRRPITEYDRTGTVTVEFDEDAVLQRVRIAAAWSRQYRPEELGSAVQDAFLAAATARAQTWGEKYADQRQPQVRPAPIVTTELGAKLDEAQARGVDTEAALVELRNLLREIRESVDSVSEQADAHLSAEFEGRSTSGHVRAVVSGAGDVLAVDFEQPWVETAHPTNLGREATEAIQDAERARGTTNIRSLVEDSALGEAARLSADPMALARRLNLI